MADVPDPDLTLTSDPDPAAMRALGDLLHAFNAETTGLHDGRMFAFWLRGPASEIVGGCFGWTWGGTCYVDTLFLPAPMRGRGLGRASSRRWRPRPAAAAAARILLQTHDFQAPGFYEKLGFSASGRCRRLSPRPPPPDDAETAGLAVRGAPTSAASSPRNRARARPRSAGRRWRARG